MASILPMPNGWTPKNVLDQTDRYDDLFTRETDPREAWELYIRRRQGLPIEARAPDAPGPRSGMASMPIVDEGAEAMPPLDLDTRERLAAEVGIDPAELDHLSPEELRSLASAFGIEPRQPSPEITARGIHGIALPHLEQDQNRFILNGASMAETWPSRERFLLFNPLSRFWTWEAIREDPRRISSLAICYAFGIVGYTLALPFRIAVFAKELFHLPLSFFNTLLFKGGHDLMRIMKVRVLCFLGASGELVSGIVGLACPPAAYWIDERIQSNPIINSHSGLRGIWKEPHHSLSETLDLVHNVVSGNAERMRNKAELLVPVEPHLREGVAALNRYYDSEAVKGCYTQTIEQVAFLGFLFSFKESLVPDQEPVFLGAIQEHIETYLSKIDFGESESNYKQAWAALIAQGMDPNALVDSLILRAVQDSGFEEEDCLEGKKEELEEKLSDIIANEQFSILYDALHKMSQAVIYSDNELLTLIAQTSGLREEISGLGEEI